MKFSIAFLLFAVSFSVVLTSPQSSAQSGAPTGTLVDPSSANGVESNPQTFENVQPAFGPTPAPVKPPKFRSKVKGGHVEQPPSSFVAPPDEMQKEAGTPEPKEKHH